MTYTIKELAELAGVSTRTLRWYDKIGLLTPTGTTEAKYRLYDETSVARLQQILFYRELEFSLADIGRMLNAPDFDGQEALKSHLTALTRRRERIDDLIDTVNKTLDDLQGGKKMTDKERFEAFKTEAIKKNEEKYGREIRRTYGDKEIDRSNDAFQSLDQKSYDRRMEIEAEIFKLLKTAVLTGAAPQGPAGKKIARLHRDWCFFGQESYHAGKHAGIAELYVSDERFTVYYDSEVKGCAKFLRDAVAAYAEEQESV